MKLFIEQTETVETKLDVYCFDERERNIAWFYNYKIGKEIIEKYNNYEKIKKENTELKAKIEKLEKQVLDMRNCFNCKRNKNNRCEVIEYCKKYSEWIPKEAL